MDTAPIPLIPDVDAPTTPDWTDVVKTIAVGLAAAAFVFLSVIGWLTLQNTYAVVHGHNSELTQLQTDERTVVVIGTYLGETQYVICRGLNLTCPPPPSNNSPAKPTHRTLAG